MVLIAHFVYMILCILKGKFGQLWLHTFRKQSSEIQRKIKKSLKIVFEIQKHLKIEGFPKQGLQLAVVFENGGRFL